MHTIKKGLDLPITGEPQQTISKTIPVKKVAVVGPDYVGLKPTMKVKVGDHVKRGSLLFEDKKNPGVLFTSPASGQVVEINRGERRAFQSVVIAVSGNDTETFPSIPSSALASKSSQELEDLLIKTGLWTSLRTRPFSKVPAPGSRPHSIFVNVMDTNPLAPDPKVVLKGNEASFTAGILALSGFTKTIHICKRGDLQLPTGLPSQAKTHEFQGPHPSGLTGTHIHFIDPVGKTKTVWSLHYQDVINIGKTLTSGQLCNERVISLAGPMVKNPTLIKTQVGASIEELIASQTKNSPVGLRPISGSVLSGRTAKGPLAYLGPYHLQVVVLEEGFDREFLGWQKPGADKFSVKNIFASKLMPGKKFEMTTSTQGSVRAMVPVGSYEKVMPLDIEPVFLLRSLLTHDTEQGQKLGVLELDEEDVALCTYVCPTKEDYGPMLRKCLTTIEQEG